MNIKMWLTYLMLTVVMFKDISMISSATDCSDSIVQQISQEIKPYQVAFFMNKNKQAEIFNKHFIIQKVARKIPSVFIELEKFNNIFHEGRSLNLSALKCERFPQFLNVILYYEFHDALQTSELNDIKMSIHTISELWSVKLTRPKCLLIRINFSKSTVNDSYSNFLLEYAWKKKLLDFSILEIRSNSCAIKSYNPFYNTFIRKTFDSSVPFQIFPNKLGNLNGYELKVGVVSSDLRFTYSLGSIIRDQKGNILSLSIEDFGSIFHISKHSNFSIIFNEIATSDPEQYVNASLLKNKRLQNNEINLEAVPSLMTMPDSSRILELDYGISCEETIAVVPIILHRDRLIIPWGFFAFICIIILIYRIALLTLKIQIKNSTLLDLFRVLLGIPISALPRGLLGALFVILILLSLIWSTNFYSSVLKLKVTEHKISFHTFRRIEKSGLEIFAQEFTLPMAFDSVHITDKYLKRIRQKLILTDLNGLISCLERLVKNKDCICIMPVSLAGFLTRKLDLSGSSVKFEFAKPIFACEKWTLKFERASAFIAKFQQYLQKFHESGINCDLEQRKMDQFKFLKYGRNRKGNNIEASQLIIILTGGYATSLVVFLIELIIKHFACMKKYVTK